MDKMYRRQRHIYDLSRKFYLLGRDVAIARLRAAPGDNVLRSAAAPGATSSSLRALTLRRVSSASTSRRKCLPRRRRRWRALGFPRASLSPEADAANFEPRELFGRACFERVMISYALSMIPPWREALAQALDVLSPGGALTLVDFGD